MKYFIRFTTCCLLAAFAALAAGCSDDDPDTPGGGGANAVTIAAKHALGSRIDNAGGDQSHSYRIVMSANEITGTAESPKLSAAGDFVSILLFAAPQDKTVLPEGTYALAAANPGVGEGDLHACRLETTDAQGKPGAASQVLVGGSVKVTHTAAGYKIEVMGQLSGQRTLSCVYEGALSFEKKQDVDPEPVYDVELKAEFALGVVYSMVMDDESSNFFLTLSDIEIDGDAEDPFFAEAGQYVQFDLYAIEEEPLILPEGTYVFTEEDPTDKTGSIKYSGYNTTDEEGEPASAELTKFSEMTATVSYTDDGYKLEATGKLSDGRTFHLAYEGMVDFEDAGEGGGDLTLPALKGDVSTSFILAGAEYRGQTENGTEHYILELVDNDLDQTYVTTNRLMVDFYTAEAADPLKIAAGNYTIDTSEAAGSFMPGSLNEDTFQAEGTYCEQTVITNGEITAMLYGMVRGGMIEISANGNQYTVTADLIDADGHTIQGTYTGAIEIIDRSFHSTLTGDKQVELTGKTCELSYFGDYYKIGADNWEIFIYTPQEVPDGIIPADGSEALQIDLLGPTGTFADGLPAGDYVIASEYTPGSKICQPGRFSNGDLYESWYLGDFYGNQAFSFAPFIRGKVNVVRSGAQYTIKVDVYDDAKPANRITASWTGTPELLNKANRSSAQQLKQRAAVRTKDAGTAAKTVQVRKKTPKHPRW